MHPRAKIFRIHIPISPYSSLWQTHWMSRQRDWDHFNQFTPCKDASPITLLAWWCAKSVHHTGHDPINLNERGHWPGYSFIFEEFTCRHLNYTFPAPALKLLGDELIGGIAYQSKPPNSSSRALPVWIFCSFYININLNLVSFFSRRSLNWKTTWQMNQWWNCSQRDET